MKTTKENTNSDNEFIDHAEWVSVGGKNTNQIPIRAGNLIFKKLADIMKDIKPVGKDSVNTYQHFKYRGIDAVCNMIHPLLAKHGVFIAPHELLSKEYLETTDSKGNRCIFCRITKKYRLYTTDGSFIESIGVGEGFDNGDKSTGKATTYAYKDLLTKLFCIPLSMHDPDAESTNLGRVVTKKIQTKQKTTPKIELAADLMSVAKEGNYELLEKRLSSLTEYEIKLISDTTNDGTKLSGEDKLVQVVEYYKRICNQSKIK